MGAGSTGSARLTLPRAPALDACAETVGRFSRHTLGHRVAAAEPGGKALQPSGEQHDRQELVAFLAAR